jgi:hypothetical protein
MALLARGVGPLERRPGHLRLETGRPAEPVSLMRVEDLPGSGDCETRIDTWGQPVLFTSSAAYIVAALFVLWWARRHNNPRKVVARPQVWAYAIGLVTAGLGSLDYHGPAYGPEPLLHDAGLAIALVAALAIDLNALGLPRFQRTWGLWGFTAVAVVVIAFLPGISPLLAAVAAVALVIAEVLVYRRGLRVRSTALYAGLAALAIGAVVFALSRTGGPLCEPDSLFQGHALWHVLTATALALWAVTALPEVER